VDVEPLTSLMIRELRITAHKFGQVSRSMDVMARMLRLHLQPDVKCDKMALNKGRSGAETAGATATAPLLPGLDLVEPESLQKEYD